MLSYSTRRFEMALPLFAGLDMGLILEAQSQVNKGEFAGLTKFMATLGTTGQLHTIRKLAAIYAATDVELFRAESDASVLVKLEIEAGDRPFKDTFADATSFQAALWESLGLTAGYSAAAPAAKTKAKATRTTGGTPSEG